MSHGLSGDEIHDLLPNLDGWEYRDDSIVKTFVFANHYETMSFVNAVAWVSHRENHHPDLEVGYKHCTMRYRTHAIDGLSENDFVCAAKIDSLFSL